jgi:hypothetical protein
MRNLIALFLLSCCALLIGCVDKPQVDPQTYGQIVSQLPMLTDAEKPFVFPYAGDVDHRNCVFKEEDFF